MTAMIHARKTSPGALIIHYCPLSSTLHNGVSSQENRNPLGISNRGDLRQGIGYPGIARLKEAKEEGNSTQRLETAGSS